MLSRKRLKASVFAGALSSLAILLSAAPALAQDPNEAAGQAVGAGLSFVCLGFYCIFGLLMLALLGLWVAMLVDLIARQDSEFPEGQTKMIWVLVLILGGLIGAIFYYFMVKKKIPRS